MALRVILIMVGVFLPISEIALLLITSNQHNHWVAVLASALAFGVTYVPLQLRYLNASVVITAEGLQATNSLKKVTTIGFGEITSITFSKPGESAPLATVRSENAKISALPGISDWPKLKEALESLQPLS